MKKIFRWSFVVGLFSRFEPAAFGGSDMKKKNINNLFLGDEWRYLD